MKRLTHVLLFDLLIQTRYGFLYGAMFSALLWIALLKPLSEQSLMLFLPPVVMFDLGIVGFYFIAVLVFYEKGQAVLGALVVSPLRFWEYLTSRLTTLTLLALVLSLVLVVFTYGLAFNLWLLLLGTGLMSLISLLVGFIAVAPFRSISSYMMPSGIYSALLYLPMVAYFGWWNHPIFYLLPTQGAMLLLEGAFRPLESWQVLYALLSSLLWIVGLSWLSRYMFNRYIIERKGRR